MVTITDDASKFITDYLKKINKEGYGMKIYCSGQSCHGPVFGMAVQEKPVEGQLVIEAKGFNFYCDKETMDALEPCIIEYVDDPDFGTGLSIRDPNAKGCESCGGCH